MIMNGQNRDFAVASRRRERPGNPVPQLPPSPIRTRSLPIARDERRVVSSSKPLFWFRPHRDENVGSSIEPSLNANSRTKLNDRSLMMNATSVDLPMSQGSKIEMVNRFRTVMPHVQPADTDSEDSLEDDVMSDDGLVGLSILDSSPFDMHS